ncbi:hypothetical protein YTPLAS18_38640 [Nitrospira sp.]|nr:hypothetical protein YTPLAS18_38640 [Nitrospira sp.]
MVRRQYTLNVFLFLLSAAALSACIPNSDDGSGPNHAADLASLKVSEGALSPSFNPDTTTYVVTVGSSVTTILVTAAVADARASLRINNQPAVSGQPFGPIMVQAGLNPPITILVDAPGISKTYSLVVTQGVNANLQSLVVSAGGLAPAFDPQITNYTVATGPTTDSTTVTAATADTASTLTINGQVTGSGQPSQSIPLGPGSTTIPVVVTSLQGQQKAYIIVITRAATTALADLQVSAGDLAPVFDPRQTSYSVSTVASNGTTTITATAADRTATIQINGQTAVSGQPFGPVPLTEGANTFTVSVNVPSVPATTYTVTVTRQPLPSNADLTSLSVSSGSLTPAFSPGTTSYVVTVATAVDSITVTATAQQGSAMVFVNNQSLGSGGTSSPIPLVVGSNIVTVVVTAPSGAMTSYTITVNRAAQASSSVDLQSLTISPGTLSPPFQPNTESYSATVETNVASVNVTPTHQSQNTQMTLNGQVIASGQTVTVPVAVGANTITIVLTAPAGNTRQYTVTVTRASPVSNNVSLRNLQMAPGTLSPAFSPSITFYSMTLQQQVSNLLVMPTAQTGSATITVNGQPVQSGGSVTVGLLNGTNSIVIHVSAPSGNSQDYNIIATRVGPSTLQT